MLHISNFPKWLKSKILTHLIKLSVISTGLLLWSHLELFAAACTVAWPRSPPSCFLNTAYLLTCHAGVGKHHFPEFYTDFCLSHPLKLLMSFSELLRLEYVIKLSLNLHHPSSLFPKSISLFGHFVFVHEFTPTGSYRESFHKSPIR